MLLVTILAFSMDDCSAITAMQQSICDSASALIANVSHEKTPWPAILRVRRQYTHESCRRESQDCVSEMVSARINNSPQTGNFFDITENFQGRAGKIIWRPARRESQVFWRERSLNRDS
jgi:hypothetical protein